MSEEDLVYVPLEERLPGDLKAWEAAALQFAVGVHGAWVREDVTEREAFSVLCGGRYHGACECKDGVPAGAEYVVCMSQEEADRCLPMAEPDVTPLLGFQLCDNYLDAEEISEGFSESSSAPLFVASLVGNSHRCSFSFDATEIVKECCVGFLSTSVDFSGVRGVTAINGFFMFGCNLQTFDFAPFKDVRCIGGYCLRDCSALTDVSLCGLENLRTVGSNFLASCKNLGSLDLRPLRSLESIDAEFLVDTGITALDLQSLHAIKHIPPRFLSDSNRLESLDCSPLTNVEEVGTGFLARCGALRTVSLHGLENVRRLGKDFVRDSKSIESLDLSPLRNADTIGVGAFCGCQNLRHANFGHLRNVRHIEPDLDAGCVKLQHLKFTPPPNVHDFFDGCASLSDESRASADAFMDDYLRRHTNRRGCHLT